MKNKRVAVTGASGFIGRALVARLLERGFEVVALSRRPQALGFPASVETRAFNPNESPNPGAFAGIDAVMHLAGESVSGRWTPKKREAIRRSRVDGTRAVVRSLEHCAVKPSVLVSASASGYYGSRGDETLLETSSPGNDFLAGVCVEWEREAQAATALGIRVVCARTGIALGSGGGALAPMLRIFRTGLGGPFGAGRQFVPWIHIEDLVSLLVMAIETDALRGPINAVAPDYADSTRFAQALGMALRRPAILPAPAFALRAVLGKFAQTLLASQLIVPAVAQDAGFSWRYRNLEDAMMAAAAPLRPAREVVRRFTSTQVLPGTLEEVFAFFSDAGNLERITPENLQFAFLTKPDRIERGTQIEYRLKIHGVPLKWKTMIAQWNPPNGFSDVQLRGPYSLWRHTHAFRIHPDGVQMDDTVEYVLPFAPFTNIFAPLAEREVRSIFDYRTARIAQFDFRRPALQAAGPQ